MKHGSTVKERIRKHELTTRRGATINFSLDHQERSNSFSEREGGSILGWKKRGGQPYKWINE